MFVSYRIVSYRFNPPSREAKEKRPVLHFDFFVGFATTATTVVEWNGPWRENVSLPSLAVVHGLDSPLILTFLFFHRRIFNIGKRPLRGKYQIYRNS
jgi:hypothetical protein